MDFSQFASVTSQALTPKVIDSSTEKKKKETAMPIDLKQ